MANPQNGANAGGTLPPKAMGSPKRDSQHGAANGKAGPCSHSPQGEIAKCSPSSSKGAFTPKPETPKLPALAYDQSRGEYWRETVGGVFVKTSASDIMRKLRILGHEPDRPTDTFGVKVGDAILDRVQEEGPVDHVYALAGHGPGIFTTPDGRRILVPRSPALVTPRPGPIENWERFLSELLGDEQLPHVVDWLACAWADLRTRDPGRWRHNQLLILAGPPRCGKSFLQSLITRLFGGRVANPWLWMSGNTAFNQELAEAEHLAIDDQPAQRDSASRARFGAKVKELAVSTTLAVHGKGKQAVTLPTFRRLTMSLNDDADYMTVAPSLEASIVDKLIMVRCRPASMLDDWGENLRRFVEELPAFAHFLETWGIHYPDQRFGTRAYLNPELVAMLSDFEPHLRLREMLDAVLWTDTANVTRAPVRVSSMDLQARLIGDSRWGPIARQIMPYSTACGVLLGKLEREMPGRFKSTRSQGSTTWLIHPPD